MAGNNRNSHLDWASFAGIGLALFGVVGGLLLEKGNLRDIAQSTAAIIVCCGTLGAVLISAPLSSVKRAFAQIKLIFIEPQIDTVDQINEIITYASKARKQGLISLEAEAAQIKDPFLAKAITLAVDGTDIDELKTMMELEIMQHEHQMEDAAKVFESGGGYAPTIGIIGAVLGLIQVMKNLENISEVGHGIAVAFVATVYGVALANLVLLPAAGKIKARAACETRRRELSLEGVIGIIEGLNPKIIRSKLEAYLLNQQERERTSKQNRAAA